MSSCPLQRSLNESSFMDYTSLTTRTLRRYLSFDKNYYLHFDSFTRKITESFLTIIIYQVYKVNIDTLVQGE